MSDSSQTLVDVEVVPEQAARLARSVLAWLVQERIVEPEASDCVLGPEDEGHRPGATHRSATEGKVAVPRLQANGVALVVGRQVFDAGGNGLELRCAGCKHTFEPADEWFEAVGAWAEGDDAAQFACPKCNLAEPLPAWRGPSQWGFGSLGVRFWNWPPLSDAFIRAVTEQLGHETVLVRGRI